MPRRAALLLLLLAAAPAWGAVSLQDQAFGRWKIQDKCIADSIKLHPDRDEASLKERDTYVDDCLKTHGLPPREHLAPPDPPAEPKQP